MVMDIVGYKRLRTMKPHVKLKMKKENGTGYELKRLGMRSKFG